MIKELTAKQKSLIPVYRDKWLNKFYSLPKLDKDKCIKGINWLYEFTGHKKPIVWFADSPMMSQYIANIVPNTNNNIRDNIYNNIRNNIKNNIEDNILDNIYNNIYNNIRNNIKNNIEDNILDNIDNNIRDNIYNNIRNNIKNNIKNNIENNIYKNIEDNIDRNIYKNIDNRTTQKVWENIWLSINENTKDNVGDSVEGDVKRNTKKINLNYNAPSWYVNVWDYSWCAYSEYFMDNKMIPENKDFRAFVELLDSGIYNTIQFQNYYIVSPMPCHLSLDEQKRLHSECGSCIEWTDGYKLYALDGVILDEKLYTQIIKKDISPKEIMGLSNKEHQMVALKYYGLENMLIEVNAQKVNTGIHKYYFSTDLTKKREQIYDLYQIDNVFNETEYFLIYDCPSTGRRYCSCVSTFAKENKNNPDLALLCAAKKRGITLEELKTNIFIES